jgi:hypothetical protein
MTSISPHSLSRPSSKSWIQGTWGDGNLPLARRNPYEVQCNRIVTGRQVSTCSQCDASCNDCSRSNRTASGHGRIQVVSSLLRPTHVRRRGPSMRRCPHRSGRKPERGAPIGIDNDREQFGMSGRAVALSANRKMGARDRCKSQCGRGRSRRPAKVEHPRALLGPCNYGAPNVQLCR